MIRRRSVSLALVGLFIWVTGCSSYTRIGLGEVADHGKVRVTTTDGERATIRNPRVEADSIKGLGAKAGGGVSDRVATSIPILRVAELEAVGTNEIGTVLTVVGVFVGTLVVIGVVGCLTMSPEDRRNSYVC